LFDGANYFGALREVLARLSSFIGWDLVSDDCHLDQTPGWITDLRSSKKISIRAAGERAAKRIA
jgi:hypothetical protein